MKVLKLALATVAALLLTACGATKYVSGVDASSIDAMALIGPVSDIDFVVGDTYTRDEVMSGASNSIVRNALLSSRMPVTVTLDPETYSEAGQLIDDIRALQVVYPKQLGVHTPTPAVRGILLENGCRYGVLVYANGFRRDRSDYIKRNALIIFFDVLLSVIFPSSVGVYYTDDLQASNLYMMVVDAQEDSILYYKKIERSDENPVHVKEVSRRVQRMVKKFYKQ